MDYINTHFADLLDLDDIDKHILLLSERKALVDDHLARRAAGVPHVSHRAQALVQALSEVDPDSGPAAIDALIAEYGDQHVLVELRQTLESQAKLQASAAALAKALALEEEISALDATSPVEKIAGLVAAVSGLEDGKAALEAQLQAIIHEKRHHLAAALAESLPPKWLSEPSQIANLKEVSRLTKDLVDLQACLGVPKYPEVWWALEALLDPFYARFHYHFREAPETSKPSKPEWAFQYAEQFLEKLLPVLLLVADVFSAHHAISTYEIITAVLKPVREKVLVLASMLSTDIDNEKHGRLLSHLIFETATFDQRLRTTYKYNPHMVLPQPPVKKWAGLVGDLMLEDKRESSTVATWLAFELRLAKERFDNDIVAPANAFEIDLEYDATATHPEAVIRPTYLAFALTKLFDTLTLHFQTIGIVKIQLRYVLQIQLVFLDQYLSELNSRLGVFDESWGAKLILNLRPGKNDSTNVAQAATSHGLAALKILAGSHCLIRFLVSKLYEWADDLVFVQLWTHCDDKDQLIFDSAIRDYNALLAKVQVKYMEFFRKEVRGAMKAYVNDAHWEEDHNGALPALIGFTITVPAYMLYLKRVLPETDFLLVSSQALDAYAHVVTKYIITNHQFSKHALAQLWTDLEYLESCMREPLLLSSDLRYNNATHKGLRRVSQSIEMMRHFDAEGAKMLKKLFDGGQTVRKQFSHALDALSANEILDLLFRIV